MCVQDAVGISGGRGRGVTRAGPKGCVQIPKVLVWHANQFGVYPVDNTRGTPQICAWTARSSSRTEDGWKDDFQ